MFAEIFFEKVLILKGDVLAIALTLPKQTAWYDHFTQQNMALQGLVWVRTWKGTRRKGGRWGRSLSIATKDVANGPSPRKNNKRFEFHKTQKCLFSLNKNICWIRISTVHNIIRSERFCWHPNNSLQDQRNREALEEHQPRWWPSGVFYRGHLSNWLMFFCFVFFVCVFLFWSIGWCSWLIFQHMQLVDVTVSYSFLFFQYHHGINHGINHIKHRLLVLERSGPSAPFGPQDRKMVLTKKHLIGIGGEKETRMTIRLQLSEGAARKICVNLTFSWRGEQHWTTISMTCETLRFFCSIKFVPTPTETFGCACQALFSGEPSGLPGRLAPKPGRDWFDSGTWRLHGFFQNLIFGNLYTDRHSKSLVENTLNLWCFVIERHAVKMFQFHLTFSVACETVIFHSHLFVDLCQGWTKAYLLCFALPLGPDGSRCLSEAAFQERPGRTLDDPLYLVYTGGTTAASKCVVQTHRDLVDLGEETSVNQKAGTSGTDRFRIDHWLI